MLVAREFQDLLSVNYFLQGAVVGSTNLNRLARGFFLHDKTIVFTSPVAETVTFDSGGEQVPLTLTDVLAQIVAQTTGVVAKTTSNGRLVLIESTPSSGVAITAAGTANGDLGLGANTGVVYNAPGGDAPAFISIGPSRTTTFLVMTEDT